MSSSCCSRKVFNLKPSLFFNALFRLSTFSFGGPYIELNSSRLVFRPHHRDTSCTGLAAGNLGGGSCLKFCLSNTLKLNQSSDLGSCNFVDSRAYSAC